MPDLRELASPLGYGAANLGNLHRELDDETCWGILDTAWECGIRHFDTAPHYGLGRSERRLGAFLRTKPRDEYVISTKVGRLLRDSGLGDRSDRDHDFAVMSPLERRWDFSAEGIRASLDESLERLGLDRVDMLYLHDPERHDLALGVSEALPALAALRDSGRVTAIGVGSMDVGALKAAVTADIDVLMVAGRYTVLESPAREVLDACADTGIQVVAASVFNSGLLASAQPTREGRYEYGAVTPEVWSRLERLVEVCDRHGVELPAAAVQYPLRHPAVSAVVVGASRASQLGEAVVWQAAPTSAAFWSEIEALVDGRQA